MEQKRVVKVKKVPQSQAYKRLKLPFENTKKVDWGEWIYTHRAGLLVTVVLYLSAAIAFLSYKIVINSPENGSSTILMEMVDEQVTPPTEQEQRLAQELQDQASYEDVMNRLSNENSKIDAGTKSSKSLANTSDAARQAQRINDMLAQGKQNYEQGMADANAISGHLKSTKSNSSTPDTPSSTNKSKDKERGRVKGNVVVSYDLQGRNDVYLHIPAYECQGGGKVVVAITVNANGRVVSASVDGATSTSDNCILEMAIRAARMSSFNASTSAPDRQRGTITYIFVPQ